MESSGESKDESPPEWDYDCARKFADDWISETVYPSCVVMVNEKLFWGSHTEMIPNKEKRSYFETWCINNNIDTIIDAAPGEPRVNDFPGESEPHEIIQYYAFDIKSMRQDAQQLKDTFDRCYELYQNSKRTLVVCQAGQDRSSLLCASILKNLGDDNIFGKLQKLRPESKSYAGKNRPIIENYTPGSEEESSRPKKRLKKVKLRF